MLRGIDKALSLTEIHVIEAIFNAKENNTSKNVAETLRVSPGTLTTSVNTLCHKGYVIKEKDPEDKRLSRLSLTEKGIRANEVHARFHEAMIDSILKNSDEKEAEVLVSALEKIQGFLGDFNFEN